MSAVSLVTATMRLGCSRCASVSSLGTVLAPGDAVVVEETAGEVASAAFDPSPAEEQPANSRALTEAAATTRKRPEVSEVFTRFLSKVTEE